MNNPIFDGLTVLFCIVSFAVCIVGLISGITANTKTFRKLTKKLKF